MKTCKARLSLYLRFLIFAVIIFISFNIHYYADYQTTLRDGVYIGFAGGDIKTGMWSVPVAADWDQDKKKDLLVGSRQKNLDGTLSGQVTFFRNVGSDKEPQFSNAILISACNNSCAPLGIAASG